MIGRELPPPLPSQTEWYFATNGESRGPLSPQEIIEFLQRGEINSDTLVWRQGMNEWLTVKQSGLVNVNGVDLSPPVNGSSPSSMSLPTRRSPWFWPKIFAGIVAGLFLIISLIGIANSPKLEVRRTGFFNSGNTLEISNVDDKPITVTDVIINERNECGRDSYKENGVDKYYNEKVVTLKVGEKSLFYFKCSIVRAHIETSRGSATYTFSK